MRRGRWGARPGPAALRRLGACWALLVALAAPPAAGAAAAAPAPRLAWSADRLVLVEGPDMLGRETVEEHLQSGLTLSFAFQVEADLEGGKATGGALVEVRFDLWDEVFLVDVTDGLGSRRRLRHPSREALADWWRSPSLALLRSPRASSSSSARVEVELSVIPFSAAEEEDARRWFSRSLDRAGETSTSEISQTSGDAPADIDRMLHLLMATSIRRSSIVGYRWTLRGVPRLRQSHGGGSP